MNPPSSLFGSVYLTWARHFRNHVSEYCLLTSLQWWHHDEPTGVSNHRCLHCLLSRLFRRRSRQTSKLHVTSLCEMNSLVAGGFPSQRASNTENVSIWWHHHDMYIERDIYFLCVVLTFEMLMCMGNNFHFQLMCGWETLDGLRILWSFWGRNIKLQLSDGCGRILSIQTGTDWETYTPTNYVHIRKRNKYHWNSMKIIWSLADTYD